MSYRLSQWGARRSKNVKNHHRAQFCRMWAQRRAIGRGPDRSTFLYYKQREIPWDRIAKWCEDKRVRKVLDNESSIDVSARVNFVQEILFTDQMTQTSAVQCHSKKEHSIPDDDRGPGSDVAMDQRKPSTKTNQIESLGEWTLVQGPNAAAIEQQYIECHTFHYGNTSTVGDETLNEHYSSRDFLQPYHMDPTLALTPLPAEEFSDDAGGANPDPLEEFIPPATACEFGEECLFCFVDRKKNDWFRDIDTEYMFQGTGVGGDRDVQVMYDDCGQN